jgi:hypothetical protein
MGSWLNGNFKIFYKENPRDNEEFRCAVEKMIMVEEKVRERLLDKQLRK